MAEQQEKGHFRCYVPKAFAAKTKELIHEANEIIEGLEARGFTLTLRQLYYQLVTRNTIPNTVESYNRLQRVISDARLAGLVSWTSLEDRGRNLRGYRTFDGPADSVVAGLREYKIDMWANQEWRPEVWVEKQAMESVIGQIAHKLRVDFYATKGYDSQSQSWRAGRRFADYVRKGQRPIVFHLGDHDPSGIDMTNDIRNRLSMFAGTPVIVQRLALNMNQVEQYNPPPNPAKDTDARYEAYRQQYGESSWELDALDPDVIMALIQDAVTHIRDPQRWREAREQEAADQQVLRDIAQQLGGKTPPEGE